MKNQTFRAAALASALLGAATTLFAQTTTTDAQAAGAELAKKLANPVASLISVPIQNNWSHRQWTVPVNAMVSQLVKLAGKPVQFQLGFKYSADAPAGGPDWGLQFTVTFLFPK